MIDGELEAHLKRKPHVSERPALWDSVDASVGGRLSAFEARAKARTFRDFEVQRGYHAVRCSRLRQIYYVREVSITFVRNG